MASDGGEDWSEMQRQVHRAVYGVTYPWHGEGHAEVLPTLQPEAPRWWAGEGYRVYVHCLGREKTKAALLSAWKTLRSWRCMFFRLYWTIMTGRGGRTGKIGGLPWCAHPSIYTLVSGIYFGPCSRAPVHPGCSNSGYSAQVHLNTSSARKQPSNHRWAISVPQQADEILELPAGTPVTRYST